MKVALVHDWLIHMRGGEKVLEALAELYPNATIYTLFCNRKKLSPKLQEMDIQTSFLHYIPGIKHFYRWLLPILPLVIKTLKIEEVDLVISSSHCVAKGIKVPEGAKHICYCHTPMRYLWGFEDQYFENYPFFMRYLIKNIFVFLRKWDLAQNKGVHEFIANSNNVKERIDRYYGRHAEVIYPPMDSSLFQPIEGKSSNYYLVVSAFVPYKKIDLVIEAFNGMDKQLLIVGSGPLEANYKKLRKSEKISFLGGVSDTQLKELYSGANALIFPTFEDFGIVPVEAQSCGCPIIAFKRGGALESVKSGVFFDEQTPESIREAVEEFDIKKYNRHETSENVKVFDTEEFKAQFKLFANRLMDQKEKYVTHS